MVIRSSLEKQHDVRREHEFVRSVCVFVPLVGVCVYKALCYCACFGDSSLYNH